VVSVVERIVEEASAQGLSMHRASPRGGDRLAIEFRDAAGRVVAGQWCRDRERGAEVARRTARVSAPGSVGTMEATGVVVQRDGADRRLAALHALARRPGVRLVAHRAERRGVLRLPDGGYTKVVTPEKVPTVVSALSTPAGAFVVPRIVSVDFECGVVAMRGLPGRTLESRLGDPLLDDDELVEDARAVGAALRTFHDSTCPAADGRPHEMAAEIAVTERWLSAASAYGLLRRHAWQGSLSHAAARLAVATPFVRVHRDLHDKQLVVAPGRPVGILDLDLTTSGEAAVDIANLLVHFELRHLQGRCGPQRADRCATALLDGYAPSGLTLSRVDAYRTTTRLRLAGVYAFRDAPRELVEHLLGPRRAEEGDHIAGRGASMT